MLRTSNRRYLHADGNYEDILNLQIKENISTKHLTQVLYLKYIHHKFKRSKFEQIKSRNKTFKLTFLTGVDEVGGSKLEKI